MSKHDHTLTEQLVCIHQGKQQIAYLHRSNSSWREMSLQETAFNLRTNTTQPTGDICSFSFKLQSVFINIIQIWTDVLKTRKIRKGFQFLSIPSSFFISSEGGWLLPVSCPELSGLELAFIDLCRRVPLPMQRMRFLKVAHISSSL